MSKPLPKTILVVDDTKKVRDIAEYFLKQEGYAVKTASNGFEALAIAKEGGIDLIVLDVMMPAMSGYEVYERLKRDETTADIPIVLLTARAVLEHTPNTFFYGLYAALSKPFSKSELIGTIRDVLKLTSKTGQN